MTRYQMMRFFSLCTLGVLFCELKGKHFASAFLHDLFCLLESHLLDFVQQMRLKIPVFNSLLPQLYGSADIGLSPDLNPGIQGHLEALCKSNFMCASKCIRKIRNCNLEMI